MRRCPASAGEDGETKNGWGRVENSMILGDDGWCSADKPIHRCPCHLDGIGGAFCEVVNASSQKFCYILPPQTILPNVNARSTAAPATWTASAPPSAKLCAYLHNLCHILEPTA